MVGAALEEEKEAQAQLRAAFAENGLSSAAAWIEVGEFVAKNDLEEWSGLTAKICFCNALEKLPAGSHDGFRADALLGYGAVLTEEGSGYRDQILTEAIDCLSEATHLFEEICDRTGYLEARFYRAYAWTELVGPQRYAAAELALVELRLLRQELRPSDEPLWRANIDFLIGSVFLDRVEGDPWENNTAALKAFHSGIRFFRRAANDTGLAQGFLHLAVAYNHRKRLGDTNANQRAILYARRAWQHCTDVVPVELRTSILSNLASALAERGGRQWVANTLKAESVLSESINLAGHSRQPSSACHAFGACWTSFGFGPVQRGGSDFRGAG